MLIIVADVSFRVISPLIQAKSNRVVHSSKPPPARASGGPGPPARASPARRPIVTCESHSAGTQQHTSTALTFIRHDYATHTHTDINLTSPTSLTHSVTGHAQAQCVNVRVSLPEDHPPHTHPPCQITHTHTHLSSCPPYTVVTHILSHYCVYFFSHTLPMCSLKCVSTLIECMSAQSEVQRW